MSPRRPTAMTSIRTVALVASTLLLVTACASGGDPPPSGSGSAATPVPPTNTPTPPAAAPTGSADPDRRGDLVRGYRSLTGTVDRSGRWVLLRAEDTTWALLGPPTADLVDGRTVTVSGVAAQVPPGCAADRALTLR
ncbi:DUF5818 domain-containing protein [Micromonospora mirobrigensis]|uniref:Uncharacterized protein n=1 Tax=Micromonospora mirobrigensis TaxID=262898 RepID=A0A1C4TXH8_9ACTN|nr:DUF5818 domain-containing protein [Micromonospora mirobrigensis]SCE64153.1 hypothetical protein GA0070564_10138 [Micromonospora mirobrigensis]